MNIWIFNHYATNQYFDHGGRHYEFAKYLIRAGYSVRIFCASTVHNTGKNLISSETLYYEDTCDGIPFVFVKTQNYTGNGKRRIFNMFDYYRNILKTVRYFEKPDVIIGSSVHPLACVAAIRLAKKYECRKIVEIRDLWPESIVAYKLKKKSNPVIKALYSLEKWIYTTADSIVFCMEGGRDYIIGKEWDIEHGGSVDLKKVHHINNGVDLEVFHYNRDNHIYRYEGVDDADKFRAVYTGSIRKVNHLETLVEVALKLQNMNSRTLITVYGDGDERELLQQKATNYGLHNIVFKGKVDKLVIPYILSKCDICLMHGQLTEITQYGMSMNKSFEYMASGRPIISTYPGKYDYIEKFGCGASILESDVGEYAATILRFENMPETEYKRYCDASRKAAEFFGFKHLTEELIGVLEGKNENYNES